MQVCTSISVLWLTREYAAGEPWTAQQVEQALWAEAHKPDAGECMLQSAQRSFPGITCICKPCLGA